jgi:hypothetical protein
MQLWYTSFAVDAELVASARAASAAETSGATAPTGMVDLSQELRFDPSVPTIDFASGTVTVTVRITNPTKHAVQGPFEIVMQRASRDSMSPPLGVKNFRPTNADTGTKVLGAMWRFKAGSNNVLPPGGKTEARVLKFRFDGGVPKSPDEYFEPVFFIFGRAK